MAKDYLNGPWKEVFTGKWAGYEMELLENPDKLTLIQIYEKNASAGIAILNKYFVGEGNLTKMAEHIKAYSLIFEKHYPTFMATYLIVSSGPVYCKKEEINKVIEQEFAKIEGITEEINEKTKAYGVDLTELRHADRKYWDKLFSEPLLMPAIFARKDAELPEKTLAGNSLIGKKITGELAEENTQSFIRTVVIGKESQRENLEKVVMENCVLNGVTVVAFDENENFMNMGVPNREFDYKTYPNIQPIGMPVKTLKPGEIRIDLNLLSPEMFREIIGVEEKEEEYLGKTTAELIDQIIIKNTGSFKRIEDIEEKLLSFTAEAKKSHMYKAIRWMRIIKEAYPDYFGGKTNARDIVSQYMKTMGAITRIEIKNMPPQMKKAFFYSVMESLHRAYKEQMSSNQLKVVGLLMDADKFTPYDPKTPLQKSIMDTLAKSPEFGVGYCLGTEHETDLYSDIAKTASMKIEFVARQEAAVKEENSRPYRASIRSRLSS